MEKNVTINCLLLLCFIRGCTRGKNTPLTNLLLGLSKGVEVGQHGVSVVFVLLPEVNP